MNPTTICQTCQPPYPVEIQRVIGTVYPVLGDGVPEKTRKRLDPLGAEPSRFRALLVCGHIKAIVTSAATPARIRGRV